MAEKLVDVENIGSYFESLSDPRHERNRKHALIDIVVIAVVGIVCGAGGPTAIHRMAVQRKEWLRGLLTLANGIPSRDCIRRVLMHVEPAAFQKCFEVWSARAFAAPSSDVQRLIAIDGKQCRRSHDASKSLGALHIVSAWAGEEGLALGQVACDDKSNEITAIPELLEQIAVKDALITIDAMGCQKEIAAAIAAKGGDFVLAVKMNQPKLYSAVEALFVESYEADIEILKYRDCETVEQGHGRIDERMYRVIPVPADWAMKADWPEVKAIGQAIRISRDAQGVETDEVRYYILRRRLGVKRFGEAVRGHWSIESMHWVLDVTFREDDSRTRERILGNNLSWLRRFAVTLLKRHPAKESLRGKMTICLMNPDFLTEVLTTK